MMREHRGQECRCIDLLLTLNIGDDGLRYAYCPKVQSRLS